MAPLTTSSGYLESWSFHCGWDWPFGYLLAKKSERGLQLSPTVATLHLASLALATLGAPEPDRLPAITENCWVSASQEAPDSTDEPCAMNKGETSNSSEPIEEIQRGCDASA